MLSVGIVGASGYTGEELTKLLQKHPEVEITTLTSRTHEGKKISEVFTSIKGLDRTFLEPNIKNLENCDVVFFATPNGIAMKMAEELLENDIRIIDISADFRLTDSKVWEEWYKMKHCAKSLLDESVYGLPEIPNQKSKIAKAETAAHVIDAKRQTYAPKTTNLTVQNTPLKNVSSANDIANYWHLTSDIRLKEDIELLGKSPSGINIYSFKYIGEEEKYQGVMAQEVLWASAPDEKGYYSVDYSKLDVDFKKLN